MSYRLIRNAAVKSCTAKIFGIGCFTKSYDCCLCQNFTELHQFAFFAMFQSSRGENPFSLMTEEHWQLQCRNILVHSVIHLLAVAANWIMQGWRQTRTICCTSQNSYIHKRSKMVEFGRKVFLHVHLSFSFMSISTNQRVWFVMTRISIDQGTVDD